MHTKCDMVMTLGEVRKSALRKRRQHSSTFVVTTTPECSHARCRFLPPTTPDDTPAYPGTA